MLKKNTKKKNRHSWLLFQHGGKQVPLVHANMSQTVGLLLLWPVWTRASRKNHHLQETVLASRSVSTLRGLCPIFFARRDRKWRMPQFAAPVIPLCRAAFILSFLILTVLFRSLYHFPFGDIQQWHSAFTGLITETEQCVQLRDNTKQTPEYWIPCGPKKKVVGI